HVMEFGRLRYVRVSVDFFSHFVVATAHTGEKARDVIRHGLQCIAVMGVPKPIKTKNGPAYVSAKIQAFLQTWGIKRVTGIPHSPAGQAIVE
ncbi:POK25 protein, partial [Stercorarius parasiticus]|nr:POK25 protein [Stercorarius parasiticus]